MASDRYITEKDQKFIDQRYREKTAPVNVDCGKTVEKEFPKMYPQEKKPGKK